MLIKIDATKEELMAFAKGVLEMALKEESCASQD